MVLDPGQRLDVALSNLMQLSPEPARSAPGFTLTDQGGRIVSLASLSELMTG
jgi:hypothetical protein